MKLREWVYWIVLNLKGEYSQARIYALNKHAEEKIRRKHK